METNYFIQQLIETKDFLQLSSEEQKLVLAHYTRNEYEARRAVLLNTIRFLQEEKYAVQPDPNTLELVKKRMLQKQPAKQNAWFQIFSYRIPLYQPALVIIILLLVLPYLFSVEKPVTVIAKADKPETIYIKDTVTIEKPVSVKEYIASVKYITVEKKVSTMPEMGGNLNPFENETLFRDTSTVNLTMAKNQLEQQLKSIGKSATDQPELNQFLVTAK